MKISELSNQDILDLKDEVCLTCQKSTSLESAAQKYMSILFDKLDSSVVLSRLFATVPYKDLPSEKQEKVYSIVKKNNLLSKLNDDTLVLTLLGTAGVEKNWLDVELSENHIGIPLLSEKFLEQIPMMSRLLKQLGLDLNWISSNDTDLVIKTIGALSGVFHVRDSATEIDIQGRKVITAQDFVEKYNIKTTFGIGGGYLGTSTFFTLIIFTKEELDENLVKKFIHLASCFKAITLNNVDENSIFIK
jgi:hypothetical protein